MTRSFGGALQGRQMHSVDPGGAIASLIISPLAVPLIYYMTHAGRQQPAPSTDAGNAQCVVTP